MDGTDVAQGIVAKFFHHLAQAIRFQQGTESLFVQLEMPAFVALFHGSPQLVAQRTFQVLVVVSGIVIDVDDPHLAAGVLTGSSLAVEVIESIRDQGNHSPSLFSYMIPSIIS